MSRNHHVICGRKWAPFTYFNERQSHPKKQDHQLATFTPEMPIFTSKMEDWEGF